MRRLHKSTFDPKGIAYQFFPAQDRSDESSMRSRHYKASRRFFAGRLIRAGVAGFLLALVFPLSRTSAAEPRGIWWWTSAGYPLGVEQVLGDNNKETEVLQFLKAWNFGRVYCSFSAQTLANPAVIRAWNTKLHAAGISSQFFLSENTWIFQQNRNNLLTVHIQPKLIDFNAAATNAAQRYCGMRQRQFARERHFCHV